MFKKVKGVLVSIAPRAALGGALLAPALASAQAVDVSGAVTDIGDAATAVGAVGAAILGVYVIRKIWQLVRP